MEKSTAGDVVLKLAERWPNPRLELEHSSAFELLIATILAAQCTDTRVNAVTRTLFKEYPTPESIVNEKLEVLAEKIRSTGFYRNKAKLVTACCVRLVRDFAGKVPDTLEELLTLPGVGRKTANIILGNVFGKPAIAVDTHVKRIANRVGLANSSNVDKVEQELMDILEIRYWSLFSNLAVLHGRYICQARRPRCGECNIFDVCNWPEKQV